MLMGIQISESRPTVLIRIQISKFYEDLYAVGLLWADAKDSILYHPIITIHVCADELRWDECPQWAGMSKFSGL